jgi:hypothetical protein
MYEDTKHFLLDTVPAKTKDIINATTDTVTSVFYGACILGGLGIAFKLAG